LESINTAWRLLQTSLTPSHATLTISYDSEIDNAVLSIDGNTATSDWYPMTIRYASDKGGGNWSYTVNVKLTADLTS
jgi:hypothetical protein